MQYFKTAASRRKADLNGLVVYASAAIIKRKEPITRCTLGYGLSALRLSVWHFCFCDIQLLCIDQGLLMAFGTEQRKIL